MISPRVQLLLEAAIDTPAKLHCVMLFAQRTVSRGTSPQIASRLMRDIWTTRQALEELALAGLLSVTHGDGDPLYEYRPRADYLDALRLLVQTYEDPMSRDMLHQSVNELARYAPYRTDFSRAIPAF
ncbi:MAG TPA: hypothetical protein VGE07_28320 [Herpetosiphonaceae bacterium]